MRALRSVILAGVAVATLAAGTSVALADPSSTPADTAIVATGSDTIQFLADQWSTDYNATSPTAKFYSFDAVNPSTGATGDTIQTKVDSGSPSPCSIARPNGSGAGIAQLQAKLQTTDKSAYCVDLARASRNIKTSDGTGITSVVFAKDLITYSIYNGGNGVTNLTDAQLKAVFNCDASTLGSYTGPVKWNEVGGTSSDAIIPVLPQASSGTRQQWLADLGITTPGTCVVNGANASGAVIEENEGTNAEFTSTGNPTGYKDVLFPFSAGSYVCQVYTTKCPNATGSLKLENIDSKAPLTSANVINVSGLTAFPSTYIRSLFLVSLNAGTATAPAIPSYLQPFLGKGDNSGWICGKAGTSTTAATDITNFGFAVASNCGALTGQ